MARLRCLTAAACLAIAAATPQPAHALDSDLARAVKAAFVYKFAAFVDWPPGAFPGPAAPFRICVVGDEGFGQLVGRAAAGQRVRDRAIAVAQFATLPPGMNCQIMFVGPYGPDPVSRDLAAVHGRPVLTVTDEVTSGDGKGIVNFVIRGGRVRFEIDRRLAIEGGLAISPKVLELAVEVRE